MSIAVPERERLTDGKLIISSSSADIARISLGIPRRVRGMTIVDLAAGCSSLVPRLLEEGADAYALDWIYFEPSKIEERVLRSRKVLVDHFPLEGREAKREVEEQAFKEFRLSFTDYPNRYKPGYLTQLPFPNEFSELTVSLNGISYWVTQNTRVLEAAFLEAVRITKPGCDIVIAPFCVPKSEWLSMDVAFVQRLEDSNMGKVKIERDIPHCKSRLRITKAPVHRF